MIAVDAMAFQSTAMFPAGWLRAAVVDTPVTAAANSPIIINRMIRADRPTLNPPVSDLRDCSHIVGSHLLCGNKTIVVSFVRGALQPS
jgi:hypothetical protein